jgi:acetylornithine deacetylase/succinyl-diaminopimelate desuccinylase-like protein
MVSIRENFMPGNRAAAIHYAHSNQEKFLENLAEIIHIPSISTDLSHKDDMDKAAEWFKQQLLSLGMGKVQIFPTIGHPVVYGEYLIAGPEAQTVLIYGHYDVQPVDPVGLWQNPPFEPRRVGDYLYGRGSSDMKGQIIITLKTVEAMMKNGGSPVNLKFFLEGEEEIGSPNMQPFLTAHKDLLKSDFALNPDAGMISPECPTIVCGLRGLAYFELIVSSPTHDLHSGLFGGVVHNPAQALCELIAGMHDKNGKITLPGFYDSVIELSEQDRMEIKRLDMDEAVYLKQTGAPALYGEKEYSPAERVGTRPSLEVHGILSGYTAKGSKTVIPATAMAKISMRLVPEQDPAEVHQQLRRYLKENAPNDIHWELIEMGIGSKACVTPLDLPATKALSKALKSVWGIYPIFKREGGSIPVVVDMKNILGIDSVLTGFGLPDDNVHAPNERIHIPTWFNGIDTLIHFFYNLSES